MWRALILPLMTALTAMSATADVASVIDTQIRPAYGDFAAATQRLAAMDTCKVEDLRPAYHDAFDAWMRVAHLHLGPGEDEGRALAIAFWPDPKALGAKAQRALLLGDAALLEPARFAEQSVAARGLMGLERLLYPTEPPPADPCPLITVTADDLARMAAEIDAGWVNFATVLATAGQTGNAHYLTASEATQEMFTQLAPGLEHLADERLGRPLGTFDKPYPLRAEARLSGRSLRNVHLSLAALRDLAIALDAGILRTRAALAWAEALAAALNDPVFQGVADPQGRLRVEILQQAVWAVRDAAIAELAPALGVGLGFNSQESD